MERNHVQQLIDDLPDESTVTLADKKQIYAAKAAYDALPDKTGVDATKLDKAIAALKKLEQGGSGEDTGYSEYLKKALANIKKTVPTPQSVLQRRMGGSCTGTRQCDVTNSYYDGYYDRVVAYVRENISSGKLQCGQVDRQLPYCPCTDRYRRRSHKCGRSQSSDCADDVTYDLKQGINGPIWALIALDSKNYTSSSRDQLIKAILAIAQVTAAGRLW